MHIATGKHQQLCSILLQGKARPRAPAVPAYHRLGLRLSGFRDPYSQLDFRAKPKGKACREMPFHFSLGRYMESSPAGSERAVLRSSQLDIAAPSVFSFLLGPAAEAAFQTPRANLDPWQDHHPCCLHPKGCIQESFGAQHPSTGHLASSSISLETTSTSQPLGEVPFRSGSRHISRAMRREPLH